MTWDGLEQFALGELGMSEDAFYSMTPRSFLNKATGYRLKKESEQRDAWERARLLFVGSIMPYLPKGSKKSIQQIYPLPWDKETGSAQTDPKRSLEKSLDRWAEVDRLKEETNSAT